MEEIKRCNLCGGNGRQVTHEGRNMIGEQGFNSTIRCQTCYRQTTAFSKDAKKATEKVVDYWNWGVSDKT